MAEATLQEQLEHRKLHPVSKPLYGFLANVVVKLVLAIRRKKANTAAAQKAE